MSTRIDAASLARPDVAMDRAHDRLIDALLGRVFGAACLVRSASEATLADWMEVTRAVAHLSTLASDTESCKPLNDIRGIFHLVRNCMVRAARNWSETGIPPAFDTWYLASLPGLLRAYEYCCKHASLASIALTRRQAEKRLRDELLTKHDGWMKNPDRHLAFPRH